jgi:hypothetical protein
LETLGGGHVEAPELRVVRRLSRLHQPVVVQLCGFVPGRAAMAIEKLSPRTCQCHKGGSLPVEHVRRERNQSLCPQVFEVAMPAIVRSASHCIPHIDDSKGADGRQGPHFGTAEGIRPSPDLDALALGAARQIELACESIANVLVRSSARATPTSGAATARHLPPGRFMSCGVIQDRSNIGISEHRSAF